MSETKKLLTKADVQPLIQMYIELNALDIHLKESTIEDVNPNKTVRRLVLDECRIVYNCDGYGNPLTGEQGK